MRPARAASVLLPAALTLGVLPVGVNASDPRAYLQSIHRHTTLTSTVPGNRAVNPCAIDVAPVSTGKIQKDGVLVGNFNDDKNLQGLGTTIIDYNPAMKTMKLFASIPVVLLVVPAVSG